MYQYKIIIVEPVSQTLQTVLNDYAAKGWKLSGFPPPLDGDVHDPRIPRGMLKVLLERENPD